MLQRPRRLRSSPQLRNMVRETRMSPSSLIYPIFIKEGHCLKEEIPSMPGQFRYSLDQMPAKLEQLQNAGINQVMFFGLPTHKDPLGSQAFHSQGIIQQALQTTRKLFPELYLITDVCMCEYTSHGHCGILQNEDPRNQHTVNNDATLTYLSQIALSHVEAGAHMVAPSDMMDGRIAVIRNTLDDHGYTQIPIMSYAIKYASAFYGPFRDAAGSAPSFGDRKTYQMDYHNAKEGLKEAYLDLDEGADILMVKPAMSYLDLVRELSSQVNVPVAAYSVSGEYSMIKAGHAAGFIDEEKIVCEIATSAFRAGASIYLTYFAEEIASYMKRGLIG